jgi:uncharacterized delta-60 repeat protein
MEQNMLGRRSIVRGSLALLLILMGALLHSVLALGTALTTSKSDAGMLAQEGQDTDLTWTRVSSMNKPRAHHTATLLQDGRVLAVGGQSPLDVVPPAFATAEIFDPATGRWTLTAGPIHPRGVHTATLLRDGRVLLSGGFLSGSNTAETFDPATETWTSTGNLNQVRNFHTSTLLPDGRVLAVGSLDPEFQNPEARGSAEIFDPDENTWTPAALIPDPAERERGHHTATLLPDGRVLVVGGLTNFPPGPSILRKTAFIFDPKTDGWTATSDLSIARSHHTAILLPNGRVLVAGGSNEPRGTATASTELFDPATETWTPVGDLNAARVLYTATLLPDGRVLATGGLSALAIAGGVPIASTEVFDPATGTWTPIGDLNIPHALHSATLLVDGRVLVAGGGGSPLDPLPQTAEAELLSSPTGRWTVTGELKTRRDGHTTTLLPNGRVLVAGGKGAAGSSAEVFDPATGRWMVTGELKTRRDGHTATLLPRGRVLVAGGKGAAGSSAEVFDPATGRWMVTGELKTRRDGHTATLLPDGRVLVAGGKGVGSSAEVFDPATGTWTPTGDLNTLHALHTTTLLPDGRVLVAGGEGAGGSSAEVFDPATGRWTVTGELKTRRNGHTTTLLLDGRVLVAGGKGAAGSSAEVFDRGLGFFRAWRPVLTSATSPLLLGDPLLVTGKQFQGVSEASGGNSGQSSPTNYPLVQLRRLDNEQIRFLLADTWSETSFTSLPVTDFPAGHAVVTVFTNSIPSISRIIRIAQP